MWEDTNYCWVVKCKNFWFHLRENIFYGHRIPLGEADVYSHPPDLKSSFKVQCDDCHKEYFYKPSAVMKYEQELPDSFTPHPLFRTDLLPLAEEMSAPDAVEKVVGVERRRSRRKLLKVDLLIRGESVEKEAFQEQAFTISVSPYGALVAMSTKVALGQTLVLKNLKNQDEIEGRVTRLGRSKAGQAQVSVEFVPPAPNFWRTESVPNRQKSPAS